MLQIKKIVYALIINHINNYKNQSATTCCVLTESIRLHIIAFYLFITKQEKYIKICGLEWEGKEKIRLKFSAFVFVAKN